MIDSAGENTYTRTPVVVIFKHRHIPIHAKVEFDDEAGQRQFMVLDLHTHEFPIHPACFGYTVQEMGLRALAVDGIVGIFAVCRKASSQSPAPVGKSFIFRSVAH